MLLSNIRATAGLWGIAGEGRAYLPAFLYTTLNVYRGLFEFWVFGINSPEHVTHRIPEDALNLALKLSDKAFL